MFRRYPYGIIFQIVMAVFFPLNGSAFAAASKHNVGSDPVQNEELSMKKVEKSDAEWKDCLSPEQYQIMRQKGTEAAFTGKLYKEKRRGMYKCASCGLELFSSDTKYDSGTGWPSFWAPVNSKHVQSVRDESHGMERTEVLCPVCGGHLGHVFDDGLVPTGKRYCINSAALNFEPDSAEKLKTENK